MITIPLFFLPGAQYDPFLIPKESVLSIIACCALIVLICPVENIFRDISKPVLGAFLFLIGCFAFSIPDSSHVTSSFHELKRWLYLLIIFLTAARVKWNHVQLKRFMKITLFVGSVISISVILEYLNILPFYMFPLQKDRLYAFFGYQNIIGQYLIIPVMWGIGVYGCSNTYKEKLTVALCTSLSFLALWLTFCRGAILSAAACSILFFCFYIKNNRSKTIKIKTYITLFIVIIFVAYAGLYLSNTMTDGKTFEKISSLTGRGLNERLTLWEGAIAVTAKNPVNGVGLGNYVLPDKINVHNELLQIGVETGLTGVIGIFVFSIVVFHTIKNNVSLIAKPEFKFLNMGIIAGCIATLIHSMVSYNLHSAASSFLFFAGLGIVSSHNKSGIDNKTETRIKIANIILLIIIGYISFWSIQCEYGKLAGHYAYNKAQSLFTQTKFSKGLEYSLKAVHYQPSHPKYHILLSRMYLKNGELELAEKHYVTAENLIKGTVDMNDPNF